MVNFMTRQMVSLWEDCTAWWLPIYVWESLRNWNFSLLKWSHSNGSFTRIIHLSSDSIDKRNSWSVWFILTASIWEYNSWLKRKKVDNCPSWMYWWWKVTKAGSKSLLKTYVHRLLPAYRVQSSSWAKMCSFRPSLIRPPCELLLNWN